MIKIIQIYRIVTGKIMKLFNMTTGVIMLFASLVMPKMDKPKEIVELQFPEIVYLDVELPHEVSQTQNIEMISDTDICNLAKIVYAEANNQSELGKRLVIDTVLNRVEHSAFPNSIDGVIFQNNQFSPIKDGSFAKAPVTSDICELIHEELENRTNYEVMFFNARHFSKYGTPYLVEQDHYFSKY